MLLGDSNMNIPQRFLALFVVLLSSLPLNADIIYDTMNTTNTGGFFTGANLSHTGAVFTLTPGSWGVTSIDTRLVVINNTPQTNVSALVTVFDTPNINDPFDVMGTITRQTLFSIGNTTTRFTPVTLDFAGLNKNFNASGDIGITIQWLVNGTANANLTTALRSGTLSGQTTYFDDNANGLFDSSEILTTSNPFQFSVQGSSITAVPEPGSTALLVMGGVALASIARKRKVFRRKHSAGNPYGNA